jgi:hypothetical protein
MKTLKIIIALTFIVFFLHITQAQAFSMKGEKVIGISGVGYYELNSDWESLYFGFSAAGNTKTAGFGFNVSFELGFSDQISGEIDLGFNRLVYASRQRAIIKESFFTGDVLGHFYFLQNDTFNPYLIFGVGALVSSSSVAPVGNVGFGMHFRITEEFSVKTELIFKSAVLLNRGEGRVGFAYHFK